jgi:long-chain acyl-CoA synthetase
MKTTRLFDLIYHQQTQHPLEKSLNGKDEKGQWRSYSTSEVIRMAESAAAGLVQSGLKRGDKVAISSYKNRPEWLIMDLATQMAGLVNIPLYPTISAQDYVYILNEAEVKMAFCGAEDLADKLEEAKKNVSTLKEIYTFDKQTNRLFWEEIFSSETHIIDDIKSSIKPEDLATIIYTSGTTGKPKGVMLSHRNIMHVILETSPYLEANRGEKSLSFLPLCHIFERAVSLSYLYKGVSIYFTGTDNLGGPDGDLQAVKPVVFSTVPRLLEKIYEAIYNKGIALTGVKKKLFFWALSLTDNYQLEQSPSFKWKIADKLIFSKWREALGGNVRLVVTGAAPCPVKIMQVFCAAGIPIREGYGLTETSPTLTVNTLEKGGAMLGTVGPLLKGVEILIDTESGDYRPEEGEILAHGPNIMLGYYKKPEINAQVFTEINGKKYFRTGDIGKLVKGDSGIVYLKITDRKKELLKTSGGKYVAPAPIENRMKEDFLIEQMMVVGDKMKFVSALIVPSEPALKNWCKENNISWTSLQEIIANPQVISRYQQIIDKYNPEFSHIEQIKKFCLIPSPWEPSKTDGSEAELTPTMKLKRRVITEKCQKDIESIYS